MAKVVCTACNQATDLPTKDCRVSSLEHELAARNLTLPRRLRSASHIRICLICQLRSFGVFDLLKEEQEELDQFVENHGEK